MLASATATIVAVQLGGLAVLCRAYAAALGLLPRSPSFARAAEQFLLSWGAPVGALLTLAGVSCFVAALVGWGEAAFGPLDPAATMRLPIVGMVLILLGVQSVLLSFTLSLTRIGEM